MLRNLLEVPFKISREFRWRDPCLTPNYIPYPVVGIERQLTNGNSGDEIAGRIQKFFDQAGVFRKEKNIAHQTAYGFRGRQVIDAIFGTLCEEE